MRNDDYDRSGSQIQIDSLVVKVLAFQAVGWGSIPCLATKVVALVTLDRDMLYLALVAHVSQL